MKQKKRIYASPKSEFTLLMTEDIITSSRQGDVLFNAQDLEESNGGENDENF